MTLEQQSAEAKSARLLDLYARFISGQTLNKQGLASEYGVTTRSIQRDMESLRCFLMEKGLSQEIIYDRRHGGYRMVSSVPSGLTNSEILAVCKILLESRSMRRDEMLPILDKLVDCAVPPEQRQAVKLLIGNEKLHYIEPHHGKSILNGLWEIGQAVKEQRVMEIEYERMKAPKLVTRRVQPVGIMFSEYYFYLTAFLENKDNFENPDDLFLRFIESTASAVLRSWTSIFMSLMPDGLRRASSVNGYSSCTAASWNGSSSATPVRPWKPFWIGSPPLRSSVRIKMAGRSQRRCSARALKCG